MRNQYRLTFKRLRMNWAWKSRSAVRAAMRGLFPLTLLGLSCFRYILPNAVWLRATISVTVQGVLFSLPERVKGPSSASLAQVTLKPAKP